MSTRKHHYGTCFVLTHTVTENTRHKRSPEGEAVGMDGELLFPNIDADEDIIYPDFDEDEDVTYPDFDRDGDIFY